LSYDFGVIVIAKAGGPIELLGIRVHHETAILESATGAEICSISFEQNVQRLFPERL